MLISPYIHQCLVDVYNVYRAKDESVQENNMEEYNNIVGEKFSPSHLRPSPLKPEGQ